MAIVVVFSGIKGNEIAQFPDPENSSNKYNLLIKLQTNRINCHLEEQASSQHQSADDGNSCSNSVRSTNDSRAGIRVRRG